MIDLRGTLLLSGSLALVLGCGAKVSENAPIGGETHWLSACDSDNACGDGLDCLCGRCTQACAGNSECSGFEDATCTGLAAIDFANGCEAPPEKLCVRTRNVTNAADAGADPTDAAIVAPSATATTSEATSATPGADAASTPSASSSDDGPGPLVTACDELSPTECADHSECLVMRGYPVDLDAQCYKAVDVPLGCLGREDVNCLPTTFFGQNSAGDCYAFPLCLAPGFELATGECASASLLMQECPASTTLPNGTYNLHLRIAPTFPEAIPQRAPSSWSINASIVVQGNQADVWLAATGTEWGAATGFVQGTAGSYSASGTVLQRTLTLKNVSVQTEQRETLQFEELTLIWSTDDEAAGTASGHWTIIQGDAVSDADFTSTIAAEADTQRPYPWLAVAKTSLLPSDAIPISLNEPIPKPGPDSQPVVRHDGTPLSSNPVWIDDARPGFVRGLRIAPVGLWPEGTLVLELAPPDAAGNSGLADISDVEIPAQPDTASNLGFESATSGWIGTLITADAFNPTEAGTPVTAPEGTELAKLTQITRLAGYLVAPGGAEYVCFTAGLIAQPGVQQIAGVRVVVASTTEKLTQAVSSSAFEAGVSPQEDWSGFTDLCFQLPAGAIDGFWVTVETTGCQGNAVCDLLLDDVRFE